jgi:membrane-associated phospholipid phosphatase
MGHPQNRLIGVIGSAVLVSGLLVLAPAQEISTGQSHSVRGRSSAEAKAQPQTTLATLPKNLLLDEKALVTGPGGLQVKDLKWVVPIAFATALTFGTDHAIERKLPTSNSTVNRAVNLSNYGAAAFAGGIAATYFWGLHTHNDRLHRMGLLAGEAALDAVITSTAIKTVSWRERPEEGRGQGRFYQSSSGLSSSFPSQHAAASWAIASVVASEYPGPLTKLFAYGGASAISVSRIIGRKHFGSDVMIGSALGWYLGRQVFKTRSPDAQQSSIGEFLSSPRERDSKLMASPYVPMDSWVYPALSRLEARGLLPTAMMGMRPWTRMECARLLDEVQRDAFLRESADGADLELLAALQAEFRHESRLRSGEKNLSAEVDSVYTRSMGIAGTPLRDPLHFGQTVISDFGRPYEEGFNQVTGATAEAAAGPIGVYVRGEYQYAPSADPLPLSTRNAIAANDGLPTMPGTPIAGTNRFRLLDSYVALNLSDWQFSFGKQSLWWGPGSGGDLMMSDNAEPVWMLRLSRVSPFQMPGLLKYIGPIRTDMFVGQLQGYQFLRLGPEFNLVGSWTSDINPQPFLWGGKISFKPTQNLELGFSVTTVFAGLGRPMTLETFKHTFSGSGNAQAVEPGDRRTGFDFSYRLPGLRRWVKLYNGSMAEDEPNPIAYPRRSAMNPGIYLVRIPKIQKLDFRAEGVYTNLPGLRNRGFFYTNAHYAGGYTNYNGLLGSWVGPQGSGVQLWSTYWFNAQKKLQFGWRQQTVDQSYIQGGHLTDYSALYSFQLRHEVLAKAWVQFERTEFPVIGPVNSSTSLAFSVEYHPPKGIF